MNAHLKTNQLHNGATPLALAKAAEDCPVASLGVRLAKLSAEMNRLDELELDAGVDHHRRSEEGMHLLDLEAQLLEQAEWLTPRSAIGALITATLMRRAFHDISDGMPEGRAERGDDLTRQFNRLRARLDEYLETVAGVTPGDLGLAGFFLSHDVETDLRSRFAG